MLSRWSPELGAMLRLPHWTDIRAAKVSHRYYAEAKPRTTPPHRPWTQSEIDQLFQLRAQGQTFASIATIFGRSSGAARERFRSGPVSNPVREVRRWTQSQLDTLVELNTQGRSPGEIANILGRPRRSVYSRLSNVDQRIGTLPVKKAWTEAEYRRLQDLHNAGHSRREILGQFPDRTEHSINAKIRRLSSRSGGDRLVPWSIKEENLLKHYRGDLRLSDHEIAKRLDRPLASVYSKLSALKCRTFKPIWTAQESEILRSSRAAGMSFARIAKLLPGRSAFAASSHFYSFYPGNPAVSSRQYSTAWYSRIAATWPGVRTYRLASRISRTNP